VERFQLTNTINLIIVVFYLFSILLFFDRTTFAQNTENSNPINITQDMIDLLINVGQQENDALNATVEDEGKSENNESIDIDTKNKYLQSNLSQILNVQNLLFQKLEQIQLQQQQQQEQQIDESASLNKDHFIKDSESIFLGDIDLPEENLMLIYQVNPFTVSNATILSKLPCDENNSTPVDILVGKLPDFQSIPLEYVAEFSDPGNMCNYKTEIVKFNSSIPFSELALYNNSTDDIEFPSSSAIHVGMTALNKNNTK
jgi:hypothetical protein